MMEFQLYVPIPARELWMRECAGFRSLLLQQSFALMPSLVMKSSEIFLMIALLTSMFSSGALS
jgi:hypothetical protein